MTFYKTNLSVLTFCALVLFLNLTNPVESATLQVKYKTFYSHLSKLNADDTNALQFAFGFMNIRTKQLCEINSGRISTEKQQIPIVITPENRFTLPSEKVLRMAEALVILELTEEANICDISVQLETKPEFVKESYSGDELDVIYQQYMNFFDGIGSFMSFLMPDVDGLTIQFKDKTLTTALANGMLIKDGILIVDSHDIAQLNNVVLPQLPLRITAKTTK